MQDVFQHLYWQQGIQEAAQTNVTAFPAGDETKGEPREFPARTPSSGLWRVYAPATALQLRNAIHEVQQ
jgi:hypothetical protein